MTWQVMLGVCGLKGGLHLLPSRVHPAHRFISNIEGRSRTSEVCLRVGSPNNCGLRMTGFYVTREATRICQKYLLDCAPVPATMDHPLSVLGQLAPSATQLMDYYFDATAATNSFQLGPKWT
jgi:hypothetical protein